VLRLTRSGPALSWSDADLRRQRAEFDRRHCIRLPSLLGAADVAFVRRQIDAAVFADKVHGAIGVELCMVENPALNLLYFLVNDERLFGIVRELTGCPPIGAFIGRVYRMVPGSGHYDSWHSDAVDHRVIGMSVNLSDDVYAGGVFQLRRRDADDILTEAPNTGAGDAIVFRIAADIVHRITAVDGSVPKTAFAGWFVSEPSFLELLASKRADSQSILTAE